MCSVTMKYDIVWKSNPYVKGVIDEPPNVGHPATSTTPAGIGDENLVTSWEKAHGFDVGNPFKPPVIHHIPTILDNFRDKTIVELGAVSLDNKYDEHIVNNFIQKTFGSEQLVQIRRRNHPTLHNTFTTKVAPNIAEYGTYPEYLDIICSCKRFVCLFSGSMALASALNTNNLFDIHCVYHRRNFGELGATFVFDNVEYSEI